MAYQLVNAGFRLSTSMEPRYRSQRPWGLVDSYFHPLLVHQWHCKCKRYPPKQAPVNGMIWASFYGKWCQQMMWKCQFSGEKVFPVSWIWICLTKKSLKQPCLSSSPALRFWWWHLLIHKKGLANLLHETWPVNHNYPCSRWYGMVHFLRHTTTWWFWRCSFWNSLPPQLSRKQNDFTEQ